MEFASLHCAASDCWKFPKIEYTFPFKLGFYVENDKNRLFAFLISNCSFFAIRIIQSILSKMIRYTLAFGRGAGMATGVETLGLTVFDDDSIMGDA